MLAILEEHLYTVLSGLPKHKVKWSNHVIDTNHRLLTALPSCYKSSQSAECRGGKGEHARWSWSILCFRRHSTAFHHRSTGHFPFLPYNRSTGTKEIINQEFWRSITCQPGKEQQQEKAQKRHLFHPSPCKHSGVGTHLNAVRAQKGQPWSLEIRMHTCIFVGSRQDNKCLVQCLNEESRSDNLTRIWLGLLSLGLSPATGFLWKSSGIFGTYDHCRMNLMQICVNSQSLELLQYWGGVVGYKRARWFCRLSPEIRIKMSLQSTCS